MIPNPFQTSTPLYTFCRICEARLNTPEEWGKGLCASHSSASPLPSDEPDWNAILEAIDASDPRADGRGMHRE